jgi:response regulator RpfG family c-di-GMP phosphodiesterase
MLKKKIMIVEDEGLVATDLARQLTALDYDVVAIAYSGEEAVEKVREICPDLILMDIVLAGKMDGIQAAGKIKAITDIPIVYLTAYSDEKTLGRAKISGPSGYILKPVKKQQLHITIELTLHKHGIGMNLRKNHARIYKSLKGTIEAIAETVELRGPYTAGHHERISKLATAIGREMGLTDFQVEGIDLASRIHDIGMVNIPADILREGERLKGTRLTLYQSHPEAAFDILKKIECMWPLAYIVLQHRECFDGSGFPRGIKGDAILIEARILAVAAAIENLTTRSSFRNAFPINEALEEVSSHSGSKYDPKVVDACLKLFKEKDYKMEG